MDRQLSVTVHVAGKHSFSLLGTEHSSCAPKASYTIGIFAFRDLTLQPLPSSACFNFAFALILAYQIFLYLLISKSAIFFFCFLSVFLGIVFTEDHYSLSSLVAYRLVLPTLEASNPPRVLGEGQVRCPSLLKKTVASLQLASSLLQFVVSLSAGLSFVHLLQFIQLSLLS